MKCDLRSTYRMPPSTRGMGPTVFPRFTDALKRNVGVQVWGTGVSVARFDNAIMMVLLRVYQYRPGVWDFASVVYLGTAETGLSQA